MVDVGSRGSYALDGGATRSPQGPHVPTRRTGQIRRGCLDRVSEVVILTTVVVTVFRYDSSRPCGAEAAVANSRARPARTTQPDDRVDRGSSAGAPACPARDS